MTLDVFDKNPLPANWEWRKLGDICDVADRDHRTPAYQDDGVPLISPRDFTERGIDLSRLKRVAPGELDAFKRKCKPAKGDILYSRIGTIGEARLVDFELDFVALHSIAMIKPRASTLSSKYLLYLLQSPAVRSQAKHNIKSVGTPDLGLQRIKNFDVPLAPPADQVAIVAELEKQFSRLDEAVANLKRVKANLKRYKAAVLKSAVEGTIGVSQLRGPGSATDALLREALAERRRRWRGRGAYREPAAGQPFAAFPLPPAWTSATIEQLAWSVEYGSSAKTSETEPGVPVLRMGNIVEGEIDYSELKYLPSDHDEFPRLLLEPGDLLFNRTNSPELVGKTGVFRGDRRCSFASYLIRVRAVSRCVPEFVAAYINSVHGRAWVKSVVTQQVGQANVNGTKLQALAIPLPPLEEQERIVAEVERRLSIVREVEAEVHANLKRAQALRQGILAKAFRVP